MDQAPTTATDRDTGATRRDAAIDGWRAVAVSCVVFAHAASFRFGDGSGAGAGASVVGRWAARLAGPLSELGVQIFFVISGYIITTLLLRETERTGRVSIAAFYARRCFRILPPLLVYYATLLVLTRAGYLALSPAGLASSASFTCNTGIVECDWWVAHTWSLAVEEQFYLFWPLIFSLLPAAWRARALAGLLPLLLLGIALRPTIFHDNFTSFGCLASGALLATSPRLKSWCSDRPATAVWLVVGAVIVVAPLSHYGRPATIALPVLIAYLVFAGTGIGWVRALLSSPPFQWVGLTSYSLYLWQQLFLARPGLYLAAPPSVLLLPVPVVLSYFVVEKPLIRVGHRLSRRLKARQEASRLTTPWSTPRGRPS